MRLFFHIGRKKRIEFEWQEDSWKALPFGWYASTFLNAYLDTAEKPENLPLVEEMAGTKGDEAVTRTVWPLLLLALELSKGRKALDLESLSFNEKWAKNTDLFAYLNGQDTALWEEWAMCPPLPYFANGNRIGWTSVCDTVARAATIELVLALMHNWKVGFRICRKCHRFYLNQACERCLPTTKKRERLLGLLREHKYRTQKKAKREKNEEAIDHLNAALREIESLQEKLRKGNSPKSVIDEYLEVCKVYKPVLPTNWVKNYKEG